MDEQKTAAGQPLKDAINSVLAENEAAQFEDANKPSKLQIHTKAIPLKMPDAVVARAGAPAPQTVLSFTPLESQVRGFSEAYLKKHPGYVETVKRNDPVLREVSGQDLIDSVLLYQGLHAIALHQAAHENYEQYIAARDAGDRKTASMRLIKSRGISQGVRRLTAGIEIHPGAQIGENFFIDHGAGVVIGETCEIGNNVSLYHDVTLGAAAGKEAETNRYGIKRRHPKIGSDRPDSKGVTLSKGVAVLGPITIGDGSTLASCALLEGKIVTGEDVSIGTEALVKGDVTIGKGVRIGAAAHIINRYDEVTGKSIPINIGDGATIDPGVLVTQDVPAGAHVVGTMPALPGLAQTTGGVLIGVNDRDRQSPYTVIGAQKDFGGQIMAYIGKGLQGLLDAAKGQTL